MIKKLKGSAFVASTMLMSQYEPLDLLMYYDARTSDFNGLFSHRYTQLTALYDCSFKDCAEITKRLSQMLLKMQ